MRVSPTSPSLKPQDVVILLKMLTLSKQALWRVLDLATSVGISQSEVSHGLERLRLAKLVDEKKKMPLLENAHEFLTHGIKYVFPARPGAIQRGIPTAHSAPPLSEHMRVSSSDVYVWPYAEGKSRGQSIEPLYPSVPKVALKDPVLYELLAIIDAIRVGKVRDRKLAEEELKLRVIKKRLI
jgi:hypothetical protein